MGGKGIKRGKREHDQRARRDKQKPRRKPSLHPVQAPADVGCQLLRLGPGEKMAEIQGVEKIRLGNPLAIIDQILVHQRNLPCRTTKVDQANPCESPHKGSEIRKGRTFRHALQMHCFEHLVDTRKDMPLRIPQGN